MFSPVAITLITKAPIRANVGPTLTLRVTGAFFLAKTRCFPLRAYKYEAGEPTFCRDHVALLH